MRAALVAISLVVWSTTAVAGGRTIMVLPTDGDADPAVRKQVDQVVHTLANSLDGEVSTGNTTFAETAAAVGCDPHEAACATTVLATLSVDEIVYGTATTTGGKTTVVVVRVAKDNRHDQAATLAPGDKPETIEPALRPLFGGTAPVTEPASGSGSEDDFFSSRERKLGFGLVAGGAVALIVGVAFWSSESGLQDQIDRAPSGTISQVQNLVALEDRASRDAWTGNIFVVLGLAASGVGTYYLVQHHLLHATVAPIDHDRGAAVLLGGRW